MASPTFSITLHHLAPGAKAAGLGYPDEQIPAATPEQIMELLMALAEVASTFTIYEPSSPEIRIKTDREVYVIRTRYRRLCFVGREAILRGEDHSIPYILGVITGVAEPIVTTVTARVPDRPSAAMAGGLRPTVPSSGLPDWLKIAVLLVLSLGCIGGGIWMMVRPTRQLAPKFAYMNGAESSTLLARIAGEYRTGTQEGDRRLVIGADGTMRIAKFGPNQAIAEEVVRTARGALQEGKPALATNDPYVMVIADNAVVLYGQTYRRATP
jgi:hypothetical protein